ncbi:MAG: hypothetical protein WCT02_03505 [Candidatus Paceibacterota bacterium]|jgi:hypothetical protein
MTTQQKTKSGRITIDDLAVMISHLEDRLSGKIDGLESRINSLEKEMRFGFTGVQNQLDNIYLNYTTMSEHALLRDRVKRIERKVGIKEPTNVSPIPAGPK